MKRYLAFSVSHTLIFICLCIGLQGVAQEWKPVPGRIRTEWADSVDPSRPLPEYPRPQFVRRNNWINLNGLWNYAIAPKTQQTMTASEGSILVPFAVESSLSGVGRTVGKDSMLWYSRTLSIPRSMRGKNILLHFGAVDWETDVFVNDKPAGHHEGGYDGFTLDITALLKQGTNTLTVKVWDPTDAGPQPRGKQVAKAGGIFYTAVTGIWQTVWLEAVNASYLEPGSQVPDLDRSILHISTNVRNAREGDQVRVVAMDNNKPVAEQMIIPGKEAGLSIPNPKTWSPESPFLYSLKYQLLRKGKVIDEADSYFAMRKSGMKKDANGIFRMTLNNEFVFQYGPLDQGWWPDGLYTAPTDEALKSDIARTRDMGFNMIRKHVKVEPARWYYFCDVLGMLVWQDMPSGEDLRGNRWESRPFIVGLGTDVKRSAESEAIYRAEWESIIRQLMNFPSIVVWTPFNEAWGQFKTREIVEWTRQLDPSRLINAASGGNFVQAGDLLDLHNYPEPAMPDPNLFGNKFAIVLGEFGGLGLPVKDHLWQDKNWGYQSFGTADSLFRRYEGFIKRLDDLIPQGLSAAVYTQTTDVEGEINGLMTYDRKVIKMPAEALRRLHAGLKRKNEK